MARRFSKKSFKFKTGIRKVNVPNLSGLSRSQAKTALESVGLTWSETSSTMQNINLDNTIESQGIASGTAVKIGDSVSFSYYLYVAPPPAPPTGPPAGPPATPPQTPPQTPPITPSTDCIPDDAGYCNGLIWFQYYYSPSGQYNCAAVASGTCGDLPPSGPPAAPPADPPVQPPIDPPIVPPFDPPSYPPLDLPPLGPPSTKSVSVSTLVRTPSGLVRAENLNVGDVLLSADLEGFPYTPGAGVTEEAFAWTSNNPDLNIVNTTIVELVKRVGNKAVIINGDIFSQWHWILVKRNDVTQFIRSEEVIEGTDYIFDVESYAWEIVDLFEVIEVAHETISINCEPYDMFFTEKMLTHDSFAI
jgi:hypothetical protein